METKLTTAFARSSLSYRTFHTDITLISVVHFFMSVTSHDHRTLR